MSKLSWLTARPVAHRGLHDLNQRVWENTLTAFSSAVDAGYGIECDLQFAADGVPVVIHDHGLRRLCDVEGDVRAMTSVELSRLPVGGTEDRIPTLQDLLALVNGAVPLVVELKGQWDRDEGFAAAVLDGLAGYAGPLALMSFNSWLLRDLKMLDCPWALGLTAEGSRPEDIAVHERTMDLGLDFISYCSSDMPNPLVSGLRRRSVPVIAWTIRSEEEMGHAYAQADQITFAGFRPPLARDVR